jgi:hypothetical protein
MPSSLPVKPNFSVVVAFMPILSSSISSVLERVAFIFWRCGFILGFSAIPMP